MKKLFVVSGPSGVGLGEVIVMFALGIPFLKLLEHSRWFQARFEKA